MDKLAKTGVKRVSLSGVTEVPTLPQIRNMTQKGDILRFLYQGEIRQLLTSLASMDLRDVTITDPDPEEIFLHYYEKEVESK